MCVWPLRLKICKKNFCRKGPPAHLKALLINSGRYIIVLENDENNSLPLFVFQTIADSLVLNKSTSVFTASRKKKDISLTFEIDL